MRPTFAGTIRAWTLFQSQDVTFLSEQEIRDQRARGCTWPALLLAQDYSSQFT